MDLIERTVATGGGAVVAGSAVPAPAPVSVQGSTDLDPGWRGTTGQRRWWRIRCSDVVDRERCLTVMVDRGRVVLVGPPGETAVLSADQLVQLRAALREAAEQAER
ncbi:hypothetical protein [Saccharothrix longispora]|uniref:hypothetical protein n=1 Tax=Saccharothrix longispora TaxID=33920 RepID=UPI0028FDC252|nr:hypothetical protein [Saccharothrix longispora]MDU0289601.1 hypothetical protein [Saccharothrix longispora]